MSFAQDLRKAPPTLRRLSPAKPRSARQQSAAMTPKVTSQPIGLRHPHRALANGPHPLHGLDHLAMTTSYSRGQEICGQSRPADNWYLVVAGSARRYVARPDGRRQIVDLLLPVDFFGVTARDEYDFTVEAISVGTTITSYPRRRVEALADSDPRLARQIRMLVLEAMSRLQAQLLIVGRVTAPEKVGSFVLEMAGGLWAGPHRRGQVTG